MLVLLFGLCLTAPDTPSMAQMTFPQFPSFAQMFQPQLNQMMMATPSKQITGFQPYATPQFPFAMPGQMGIMGGLNGNHMHAGRPGAPDLSGGNEKESETAATTQKESNENQKETTTPSNEAKVEAANDNDSKLGTQANAQTELSSSTMLGSLMTTGSQMGVQLASNAHTLFVPPYSWMWRVALSAASLKYDGVDKIADVPEIMNLVTGYYAGSPDAIQAARKASENPSDRFSLTSLSQLFQGPSSYQKASSSASSMSSWFPAASSSSSSAWGKDDGDDDEVKFDEANQDDSSSSGMFGQLFGGDSTPHHSKPSSSSSSSSSPMGMFGQLLGGKPSQGSNPMTEQMIKMAANQMGLNPQLVNMAAPMIGSMM